MLQEKSYSWKRYHLENQCSNRGLLFFFNNNKNTVLDSRLLFYLAALATRASNLYPHLP